MNNNHTKKIKTGRNPLVFISCGQYTETEKSLGKEVKNLVERLTPYEVYFAETVTSLESLTNKIFGMLNQASGLITIMHHRGNVSTPDGTIIRGSLWIEQEIAIAAFLQQTEKKNIEAIAFIQEGVNLEGVRHYLHFNPRSFKEDKDILEELKLFLPEWKLDNFQTVDAEKQTEVNRIMAAILNELKFNFEVAKAQKPWTTYSIQSRNVLGSLESLFGKEIAEKISALYLDLESKNSLISRVRGGCWSEQYYKKYYGDIVESVEAAINMLKERKITSGEKPEIRRVGLDYPAKSGLQKELERQGYTLSWSRKDMDAGCEPIILEQDGGRIMLKDETETLTLLRKKKST